MTPIPFFGPAKGVILPRVLHKFDPAYSKEVVFVCWEGSMLMGPGLRRMATKVWS